MSHQVEQLVEVRRIERLSPETVRLTLIAVHDDATTPRPWNERYLDVPVEDEVPTGTRFMCTETYVQEVVAE